MDEIVTNSTFPISSLSYSLISVQGKLAWSMLVFLIFGNIGNLCNCFIFLQNSLRSNPCSYYLLVSSIANIIALTFVIPTGIYAVEQVNLTSQSLIYCKLRLYIYHTLLMISRYSIVYACIDRACLTSQRVSIRNFSQIRTARISSLITILFWPMAALHLPILSTIQSDACIMPGLYNLLFGIYALVFAGIIPPTLMSIFSLITVRNLHAVRVRIHPSRTQINRLIRQRDFHLTRMLIAQVVVYVFTTTPYPLNIIYTAITTSANKNIDRQIMEAFVFFLTGTFFLFINPTVAFYIYISTSKTFRGEFKTAIINLWKKIFRKQRNNTIRPNVNVRSLTRTVAQQQEDFQKSSAMTIRPSPDT